MLIMNLYSKIVLTDEKCLAKKYRHLKVWQLLLVNHMLDISVGLNTSPIFDGN